MFTGLIEETGRIHSVRRLAGQGLELHIQARLVLADLRPGDSLAINGVCQTICRLDDSDCTVQAVGATLDKTTLGRLSPGSLVNLERACRADTRLGGHLVQGHVSGIGWFRGTPATRGPWSWILPCPRPCWPLVAPKAPSAWTA